MPSVKNKLPVTPELKANYTKFAKDLAKVALKATAENFAQGEMVVVLEGHHDDTRYLASKNSTEFHIGTINGKTDSSDRIQVNWNGYTWWLHKSGLAVKASDFMTLYEKHSVPAEFDYRHLERLVLDDESKNEIKNVIKQHKYLKKIFDEWGLGEIMEYGRSMSLLFYGPPGTGKTWAATQIAKTMGRELLVISAAEIQTSEPGGANRNIQQAFEQARINNHVLFLDECDGLITDRAHVGMILASEINTLLTCLEQFEGVVVFATNRADTLDPAMARRISLMLEFKNPDEPTRLQLWQTMLPSKLPLAKDVDLKKLAKFELTGGYIKNAILTAARAAASEEATEVKMKHFAKAIKRIKDSKDVIGTHTSRKQDFVKARG